MNPLIKKEIRLLLPSWLAVLSLAIFLPWLLKSSDAPVEMVLLFAFFGLILLGVDSFGREFQFGKHFKSLLALPVKRRRIWRVKIIILVLRCSAGDGWFSLSATRSRFLRHPLFRLGSIIRR